MGRSTTGRADLQLQGVNSYELLEFANWIKQHRKSCRYFRNYGPVMLGDVLQFIFTPTGIGVKFEVRCACGTCLDCTDYKSW
jgi:hypothetical protein